VIINGKLAAAGDYRAIRDKMDDQAHVVRIRADHPRWLAVALIGHAATRSITVDAENRIVAETHDPRAFYRALPALAKRAEVRLYEVQAADESLQSVFSYLVRR
jgi:ABC-2 type transport system ATP-binding protein